MSIRHPKNAFELFEKACRLIEEEPRRYVQSTWCERGAHNILMALRREGKEKAVKDDVPMCGTAGCRAGWIVLAHDGMRARPRSWDERVLQILKLDRGYEETDWDMRYALEDLFNAQALENEGMPEGTKPGTKRYARAGVKGLRQFMREYKDELRATPVNPKKEKR